MDDLLEEDDERCLSNNSSQSTSDMLYTIALFICPPYRGDVMVLNIHFVMVSQQFVMDLSLVAKFHYVQITTFVGNLTKIVEICLKWLNYLSKIMENLPKMVDLVNSLRLHHQA